MSQFNPAQSTKNNCVILLNGASSSGKSTVTRHLQASLPTPFLVLSSDQLVDGGALPPQRDVIDKDIDNVWSWQGRMRPRFFAGFHRCIRGMADAGNDIIVDHVVEYDAWWRELEDLLVGLDVWIVGVKCQVEEIERREARRADRREGEGRSHLEVNRVHEIVRVVGGYDWEVDTTGGVNEEMMEALVAGWNVRKGKTLLVDV